MPIDRALLQDYFNDKRKHPYYQRTVEMAEAFLPHSDGVYPTKLIDDRRPNEPLEVKEYRKQVWKPKTKPTFGRILSSLGKIRRSSDWSISYPKTEFNRVTEGETLQDYCEVNFPKFKSVTNWVFSLLLKKSLIDPNAVCIVVPMNREMGETEYFKPFPYLFGSADVYDYVDEDYALLVNPAGSVYYTDRGRVANTGKSFFYADTEVIEKWNQVNAKGDMKVEYSWAHGLGEAPFFKIGGVAIEASETDYLFASRIEDMLPELDEAVREYSDLQAGKVRHMHPERWEYTQTECTTCRGTAVVQNPNYTPDCNCPPQIPCTNSACKGGYVSSSSPYTTTLIRPNSAMDGATAVPTPPIGYINKPIDILEFMDKSVDNHIFRALSAINFQFLDQSPLSQSGIAKEVDKDELNNTVNAIAEDLVRVMDNIYRLVALYRYRTLYGNEAIDMLPTIPVPERFDILSANYLGDELDKAKKGGFNASILNALELEYASKKFNADHDVREMLEMVLGLDPLSNLSEDEKISRLSNKGIKMIDYVISSNIQGFIRRAIEANEEFPSLQPEEQRAVLQTMAADVITDTTAPLIPDDVEDEGTDADIIGKIPLAVQQLSLAATRASEAGDTQLANTIKAKINQLLGQVVETVEDADLQ